MTNLITDTILQLRQKLNGSAVVISHDLQSIFAMADYVAMLFEGAIIAYDTADAHSQLEQPDRAAVPQRIGDRADPDLVSRVARARIRNAGANRLPGRAEKLRVRGR